MIQKTLIRSLSLPVLVLFCQLTSGQDNYRPSQSKSMDHSWFKNGKINIISSSHQDIAWMDSIGACEVWRDVNMITPALKMLSSNPGFKYTVEDALCLKEYLERHPEKYDEILKYSREGRLEWGATYVQPYESMYDGEALIRQTYLGRKWLRETLPGCDFTCAYSPDVPGRALQMSQILAKSGIKYLHFSRHEPGVYRWYSPDGSNVLAFTPGQYDEAGIPVRKARNDQELKDAFIGILNNWNAYYRKNRMLPYLPFYSSSDWSKPVEYGTLLAMWNSSSKKEKLPSLGFSTGEQALKMLDGKAAFEELRGERPNVWLYIHGPTHERALTASRKANRMLTAAEKFASLNSIIKKDFSTYPEKRFTASWEKAIYPDHGWGGKHGDLTDLTFRKSFETALGISEGIFMESIDGIAAAIDFKKEGRAIVVFNPLSWERTDKVILSVDLYGQPATGFRITEGGSGKEIPYQLIKSSPAGGSDETATLVFIAGNVPSMGYKTFYLEPFMEEFRGGREKNSQIPVKETNPADVGPELNSGKYENKYYRLTFEKGGLKSIYDKEVNRELLNTDHLLGGEVFQLESIGNGAGEFTDVQPVSMNGFEKVSQYGPAWSCSESGKVRKSWEFTQQTKFATIRQKVTLYEELKEIEFTCDILGFSGEHYREYRMAFPLSLKDAGVAYEVPMGVVRVGRDEIKGAAGFSKPDQVYSTECAKVHPREVQDWFSASGDSLSVSISASTAVFDWIDPTDPSDTFTILQPVLLASRRSCHGEGNYYLQPGNHSYSFTLTSGTGDWKGSIQRGKQANMPLQAILVDCRKREGGMPEIQGFASVDKGNVLITTLKKTDNDDSYIIRLCEMAGEDTDVTVKLPLTVRKLMKTNMIEEEGMEVTPEGNSFRTRIGHNAIETFRIWF